MANTAKDTSSRSARAEWKKVNKPETLSKEHNGDKKFMILNKEQLAINEQFLKTDPSTPKQQRDVKQSMGISLTRACLKKPLGQSVSEISRSKLDRQKVQRKQKPDFKPKNQKEKVQRILPLKPNIDQAKHSPKHEPNTRFLGKESYCTSTEKLKPSAIKEQFKELVDIPPKEFENNFREWMERDDVARSLQAKLRADLIHEFNTTALGKQMRSFVASKMPSALQPLSFALHTLVAEFLHAENSHFSLSVFCSEVPYRNALPDFETRNNFRFHDNEIQQLMEAIMNKSSLDVNFLGLCKSVERTYSETSQSLLYAVMHKLVEAAQHVNSRTVEKVMHAVSTTTDDLCQLTSPSQRKITRSVGTMARLVAQSPISGNTPKRSTITKGTSTVELQLKPVSIKTQTSPLQKQSSATTPKPLQCDKATTTDRKRGMVSMGMQTVEPELQHLMFGHLITLLRRVRELVVICEMSLKPQPTDGEVKLNIICRKLEMHTIELTQMRTTEAGNNLDKLQEIFTNLRHCAQSLKQVMIIRSQASTPTKKSSLSAKRPTVNVDTATQTQSQHWPLTELKKNVREQAKQLSARQTVDTGQQTEPSKQTVATNTTSRRPVVKHSLGTNTVLREMRSVEQQTSSPEKTYEDWVYEMGNTPSGQKFLDRVEASLRKALNKQEKKLYKLYDIKLRHQRELMRMRYKRPSTEEVGENVTWNANAKARELMDAVGKQITEFESRQQAIFDKIKAAELAGQHNMPPKQETLRRTAMTAPAEIRASAGTVMEAESKAASEAQATKKTEVMTIELHNELKSQAAKLRNLALVLRDHLPKPQSIVSPRFRTIESQTEPETKITQAVAEAKARIQELENESSLLENNFLSYMEHMRHEKNADHEATKQKETDCALECKCLKETIRRFKELQRPDDQNFDNYDLELEQLANKNEQKCLNSNAQDASNSVVNQEIPFTNAISEAKRRLFDKPPWLDVEPTKEFLAAGQQKPKPVSASLKEEVRLSILEQQIADWQCKTAFVSQHDISHGSGGDGITQHPAEVQKLQNFKAPTELKYAPLNVPSKLSYTTGLDSVAATVAPNTLKTFLATAISESSDDDAIDDDDGINEEWRKRVESDGNDKKQSFEPTTIVDLKLSMSSSSSSTSTSSSCSSLEEAFDCVYKKHGLLQTGDCNIATLQQPLTMLSPAKPLNFTALDKRNKLQRTFAKMQTLFAPQALLGDGSHPSFAKQELNVKAAHYDMATDSAASTSTGISSNYEQK